MVDYSTMNDLDLVERAQAGDRAAFEEIYRRYKKKISNQASNIINSPDDLEDVVQEVFCQAFRGIRNFRGESRIYTWLYRITFNVATQIGHKIRRRPNPLSNDILDRYYMGSRSLPDPQYLAESRLFLQEVMKRIGKLSPVHIELLMLGPIGGFSYREIGLKLGVSEDVIKGRMYRARENLRRIFNYERSILF